MAFTITTPRLLENWNPMNGDTILPDGTLERPQTKHQRDNMDTLSSTSIDILSTLPEQANAARGVLARACTRLYSINGWISGY